jgi:hypothetical protein
MSQRKSCRNIDEDIFGVATRHRVCSLTALGELAQMQKGNLAALRNASN